VKAQELLLILDQYWSQHDEELRMIPIYYMATMTKKCMSAFETYTGAMNASIERQMRERNPFQFQNIKSVKSSRDPDFDGSGPCIVLASPGMLQSGNSRELFENWCGNSRNTVLIAGYAVSNTMAHDIKDEPESIETLDGRKIKRKIGAWCAFSGRCLHSRMPLDPTHVRFKRTCV
jgi:cleavage and polyadenylation specificity factor subunit 3